MYYFPKFGINNLLPAAHGAYKFRYIYNNSKLWQKPIYSAAEIIRKEYFKKEIEYIVNRYSQNYFVDKKADIMALEELELCYNISFVEQEAKRRQWEKLLRRKGITKLSIGKNILIKNYFGYTLTGYVPTFVLRRLSCLIFSSGILEWWNRFVSVDLAKIRTTRNNKYEKFINTKSIDIESGSSRNIFLLFYLILQILLVATFCFVLEVCYFERFKKFKFRS